MGGLARLNRATAGWWVLQDFDTQDLFATTYDRTNYTANDLPVNYGARYTWTTNSDGIPVFQHVTDTQGIIGGWIFAPKTGSRGLGYWAQVIPAKITTTGGTIKATPIKTGNGSGWTTDTSLGEITCFTSDGSAPSVGTFGVLVIGTETGAQNPLFFQGSSGAAGDSIFKITGSLGAGTYSGTSYDYPGGTAGATANNLKELNGSTNVPTGSFYVKAVLKGDGNYWFNAPYGC